MLLAHSRSSCQVASFTKLSNVSCRQREKLDDILLKDLGHSFDSNLGMMPKTNFMCDEIIEKKDIGGLDSSTNRNEINYGFKYSSELYILLIF